MKVVKTKARKREPAALRRSNHFSPSPSFLRLFVVGLTAAPVAAARLWFTPTPFNRLETKRDFPSGRDVFISQISVRAPGLLQPSWHPAKCESATDQTCLCEAGKEIPSRQEGAGTKH